MHARSGGNIEVMGMMQGKVQGNTIIIMDAFALPVEGTETRVNAQVEGYEYMVQYMTKIKEVRFFYDILSRSYVHAFFFVKGMGRSDIDRKHFRLTCPIVDVSLIRSVAWRTPLVGTTRILVMDAGCRELTSTLKCRTSSSRIPSLPSL